MKLFKSIFWLSIAFLAVGPQVNAVETISELSRQTLSGGSQLIAGQLDHIECEDLACVGGKMAVASTLSLLPAAAVQAPAMFALQDDIPFPRPPLNRT